MWIISPSRIIYTTTSFFFSPFRLNNKKKKERIIINIFTIYHYNNILTLITTSFGSFKGDILTSLSLNTVIVNLLSIPWEKVLGSITYLLLASNWIESDAIKNTNKEYYYKK